MNSEARRTMLELVILSTKCDDMTRKEIIEHLTAIKYSLENPQSVSKFEQEKRIKSAKQLYNVGTCGISMRKRQAR